MFHDLADSLKETESPHKLAKLKHVQACLLPASQYSKSAGFAEIELAHQAAASLSLADISLATQFLGHELRAPLMIAPMTGGVALGGMLNERWAKAAEYFGLPFGVGSQRIMLRDESVFESFNVRKVAKTACIFANLGAAQILGADGVESAKRVVASIEASALFLHLNPMQEACKSDGDTSLSGLLAAIAAVVKALKSEKIPVLVREVGFGLSEQAAKSLITTGIDGLDCAGAGGTSWAKVEAMVSSDGLYGKLGQVFGEWGIPTAQSIRNVRAVDKTIPLVATGGLRSGLDVAKALALGADLGAMARPMLMAAIDSEEALFAFIEQTLLELRVAMYGAGVAHIDALKTVALG